MLFVELPKRPTPTELLAIEDPEKREAACAAFVASVGVEKIPVPRDIEAAGSVEGFVEGQKQRLWQEAAERGDA